jgi:Dolichyl-phosphate-mannose-protein mannosyltransferase
MTSRTGVAFLALLALALLVRVGAVVATPHYVPRHDDRDYDRLACWVAEHGLPPDRSPPFPRPAPAGCATHAPVGAPTAYRPPLWPLVLGTVYAGADVTGIDRWTAGRLAQAAIGTAIVALIGLIAAELWGAAAGLVALGLGAVFLPLILDGTTLISEPLFVALELAAVWAALRLRVAPSRLRWAVAAGVLAGLAALTRSTAIVLAVPLLAAMWAGRGGRAVAVFAAAAILVAVPWTIRNAHVLRAFVPVSTETGPTLLGTYNPAARDDPGCTGCWILLSDFPRERPLARRLKRLDEVTKDRESRALAIRFMRRHPGYPFQVAWENSVRLVELGGAGRTRFAASTIDVPPGAAVVGAWELWAVLVAAVAGAAMAVRRRAPGWLIALLVLLWVATVFVQSETPRFRAPIDPFIVMLAAVGAVAVYGRVGGRLRRRVVPSKG